MLIQMNSTVYTKQTWNHAACLQIAVKLKLNDNMYYCYKNIFRIYLIYKADTVYIWCSILIAYQDFL